MKQHSPLILVAIFSCFLWACNKNNQVTKEADDDYQQTSFAPDPYFVTIDMAKDFAERIDSNVFLNYTYNNVIRSIDSFYAIPDANGMAALYVFNYSGDMGYSVISADLRFMPVCAFVTKGSLLKSHSIPSMLGSWFGATVERIDYLRSQGNLGGSNGIGGVVGWVRLAGAVNLEDLLNPNVVTSAIGKEPCYTPDPPTITVRQPLMETEWGQRCFYNDSLQDQDCATCNERVLTGCVATAMAQIVCYWEHQPFSYLAYDYSSMPNFAFSGQADMARLIRDCGISVNTSYGCGASGADMNFFQWLYNYSIIPSRFNYNFDFTSGGTHEDYDLSDRWVIKQDLDQGRPLLLSGYTDQSSFMWWSWGTEGGHQWVCDGFRSESDYCRTNFWFHMNWGWNGASIGMYFQSDWDPPQGNYQYQHQFIHNIYP